jgi:hypothetical protein
MTSQQAPLNLSHLKESNVRLPRFPHENGLALKKRDHLSNDAIANIFIIRLQESKFSSGLWKYWLRAVQGLLADMWLMP